MIDPKTAALWKPGPRWANWIVEEEILDPVTATGAPYTGDDLSTYHSSTPAELAACVREHERNRPREGNWMQLFSGRAYWPIDPRPDEVSIVDIAHSLAMQCRYGGHSRSFYSVAEHSVLLSYLVPVEHALAGLMHDATEAYVSDVPRPLKGHLQDFEHIEELNWIAIAEAFDLPLDLPVCVHEADVDICRAEMAYLLDPPPIPIEWPRPAPELYFKCLGPTGAKKFFLDRFEVLWGRRMVARYPAAAYKEAA